MRAHRRGLSVDVGGRRHRLEPGVEWLIGRGEQADLQILDPLISRMHAVVHHTGEGWRVTDLASANGIWRDGTRVAHSTIGPQPAIIRLGGPDGPQVYLVPDPDPDLSPDPDLVPDPAPAPAPAPDQAVSASGVLPAPGGTDPPPTPGTLACHDLSAGALLIGRALSNGVVLSDLLVSREHAKIWTGSDGTTLLDLDSGNGTYVNGRAIRRCRLHLGDLISIGPHRLCFEGTRLVELDHRAAPDFAAAHLSVTVDGDTKLLHDVSFSLPPRTLMAIVGPSGAGKSTLLNALSGLHPATSGQVLYGGRDLYREYAELRQRIGFVPQQDILHRVLTVEQALGYGARLRFPAETTVQERAARVHEVAAELRLSGRLGTRIDKLSGGERKRASTAMELITRPALLFLDEPTSGLDIDLDREVMQQLRTLADDGRTVVVVTHNLDHVDQCDVVLVLTTGGRVAYLGPPGDVFAHFGVSSWADVFSVMKTRTPQEWAETFEAGPARDDRSFPPGPPDPGAPAAGRSPSLRRSARVQLVTLARRQLAVTAADRALLAILVALPAVLALLSRGIPRRGGLSRFVANEEAPQLLVILIVGAALMGAAGSVRELVRERTIHLRERAVGVSWVAYLMSKVLVLSGIAAVQGAVLASLALVHREQPAGPAVLPWAGVEIVVVVAAVTVVSTLLGLVLSGAVRDESQAMPLLVMLSMAQLVVSGGIVPVVNTEGLRELSWFLPARWGFAATAATVDLQYIRPEMPRDHLWDHTSGAWWSDITGLVVLAAVSTAVCAVLLLRLYPRRPKASRPPRRVTIPLLRGVAQTLSRPRRRPSG